MFVYRPPNPYYIRYCEIMNCTSGWIDYHIASGWIVVGSIRYNPSDSMIMHCVFWNNSDTKNYGHDIVYSFNWGVTQRTNLPFSYSFSTSPTPRTGGRAGRTGLCR